MSKCLSRKYLNTFSRLGSSVMPFMLIVQIDTAIVRNRKMKVKVLNVQS